MTLKGASTRRTETSGSCAKTILGLMENLGHMRRNKQQIGGRSLLRTGKVIGHLFSKFTAQHGVEIGVSNFGEVLRGHCSFRMVSLGTFFKNVK